MGKININALSKSKKYPGAYVKGSAEIVREAEKKEGALLADLEQKKAKFEAVKKAGYTNGDQEYTNASNAVSIAQYNYDECMKALSDPAQYHADSYRHFEYEPGENGYALNTTRNIIVDAHRVHIPVDIPNSTACADQVNDGEIGTARPLSEEISMIDTDASDTVNFSSVVKYGLSWYNDDSDTAEKAVVRAHDTAIINAENKKACEIFMASKQALVLDPMALNISINENLCGPAKKNAVIITNKSGFAKLDQTDANGGYPLVKRDSQGNFIYRDKYPIVELSNDILPNDEIKGVPVIIGDMSVLKFFMIRQDEILMDDWSDFNIKDHKICQEIITLSTRSNEMYIVGHIAGTAKISMEPTEETANETVNAGTAEEITGETANAGSAETVTE